MADQRTLTRRVILALLAFAPAVARAQEGDEPGAPKSQPSEKQSEEEPPRYRNPQGAIVAGGIFGVSIGENHTVIEVGAYGGYAVFTGVLPGLRALIISDDGVGAELATSLTLTPPVEFYLVPFLMTEVGRRFQKGGGAWLSGVGFGAYLGEPSSPFGLQAGWMFRRLWFDGGSLDGSGPIVILTLSFFTFRTPPP